VPPPGGTHAEQLGRVESLYADTRELYFQIYVTDARGSERNLRGASLTEMRRAHRALRERVLEGLGALDSGRFGDEDRRAIRTMQRHLVESAWVEVDAGGAPAGQGSDDCRYDPADVARGDSAYERLSARLYACFGSAARRVITGRDTSDRLTVLGQLGTEPSPERRRELFLALRPIWEAATGTPGAPSPYRTLLPLSARRWRERGSPIAEAARSLALDPAGVESTLVRILSTWRDHTSTTRLEPWDWYYANGEASRALSGAVRHEALRDLNDTFYRDQGADPAELGIRYDLEPREGKSPVAFSQFGKLPRLRDGRAAESEAWVFATYRTGGFDNLVELLHETGHAIHVSAVAARPAFADWPDSDPFTEALADLLALEAYERDWQRRYLKTYAPPAASLRAKYASIVMDVAWALLELRVHADPTRDPNAEWAAITRDYLHMVPHPEWGWWAMRGQLFDGPGYMMNYALGAMISAALRERVREARGPFSTPDRKMYDWLSERLYRFGLSRFSRDVLRDVLGGPLTADALLRDMRRLSAN